jgi:hypothetical protein
VCQKASQCLGLHVSVPSCRVALSWVARFRAVLPCCSGPGGLCAVRVVLLLQCLAACKSTGIVMISVAHRFVPSALDSMCFSVSPRFHLCVATALRRVSPVFALSCSAAARCASSSCCSWFADVFVFHSPTVLRSLLRRPTCIPYHELLLKLTPRGKFALSRTQGRPQVRFVRLLLSSPCFCLRLLWPALPGV